MTHALLFFLARETPCPQNKVRKRSFIVINGIKMKNDEMQLKKICKNKCLKKLLKVLHNSFAKHPKHPVEQAEDMLAVVNRWGLPHRTVLE